jgi:hypothetical protein
VLFNTGKDVHPPICRKSTIDIIYMNGNERTKAYFGVNTSTVKTGYPVSNNDQFVLNTQLMNMEDREKYIWVTLTYDYIPDPIGIRDARLNWLTMSDFVPDYCTEMKTTNTNPWGTKNVTRDMIPLTDVFAESSIPVRYPLDGLFLGAAAHIHDGGTNVEVFQNDKTVCNSTSTYEKSKAAHLHGGSGNGSSEHIVKQTVCAYSEPLPVKAGDKFWMRVKYDFKQYPG